MNQAIKGSLEVEDHSQNKEGDDDASDEEYHSEETTTGDKAETDDDDHNTDDEAEGHKELMDSDHSSHSQEGSPLDAIQGGQDEKTRANKLLEYGFHCTCTRCLHERQHPGKPFQRRPVQNRGLDSSEA